MTGWLATKCLLSAVPIKDVIKYNNCVCQAVITQVNSVSSSHVIRVHVACHGEVSGCSGQFSCTKCGTTHLNEMPSKPGKLVSLKPVFCLFLCFFFTLKSFKQAISPGLIHLNKAFCGALCLVLPRDSITHSLLESLKMSMTSRIE